MLARMLVTAAVSFSGLLAQQPNPVAGLKPFQEYQQDGQSVPLPPLVHICAGGCSAGKGAVLVMENGDYVLRDAQGIANRYHVVKFTPESVILERTDYRPRPATATISGRISSEGNTLVEGKILFPGATSPNPFKMAWGDAIDTVPGDANWKAADNTTTGRTPARVQNVSPVNGPTKPTGSGPSATQTGIPQSRRPPMIAPGKLRLDGQWVIIQVSKDRKNRIVYPKKFIQEGDDITVIQDDDFTGWKGVTTFKGHLKSLIVEGVGLASESTPEHPILTSRGRIVIDDPDHIHFESGDERVPLIRVTAQSDDVPCDADNSSGTTGWFAWVRGSDAIARRKDFAKGACWLVIAANSGEARGQSMLAYLFYKGQGVRVDYERAFDLAQKSAAQKEPFGETLLSTLYKEGKGVAPDPQKAAFWSAQVSNQRNGSIWSHMDDVTPSGLTPRQAIGLILGAFAGSDAADYAHYDHECRGGNDNACLTRKYIKDDMISKGTWKDQ